MPLDIFPVGNRRETPMTEDEKDFEEYKKVNPDRYIYSNGFYLGWVIGRRTLREKIEKQLKKDEWEPLPPINTTGGQGSGPI